MREVLAEFDAHGKTKSKPHWRSRLRSEHKIAERSLAIARSRAEQGASLRGQDLERTFGDPFQFLAERIDEQAAIAFCVRFNAPSINTALRILGWLHVYQTSPPSIAELLSGMVCEQNGDFEDVPTVSPRIQ